MIRHPWLKKYTVSKNVKHLIIGTHPPMPYCGKLDFYYGNMSEFWRFLDSVYPKNNLYSTEECPKLKNIQDFLAKTGIAITDMVEQTDGTPFSTDNKMIWTKLNTGLKDILIDSQIETIYFTSFGGKNSALNLFKKWLKAEINTFGKINLPDNKLWRKTGYSINLSSKLIEMQLLFSPSPMARIGANRIKEFQNWLKRNQGKSYDDFRIYWYKEKLPKM